MLASVSTMDLFLKAIEDKRVIVPHAEFVRGRVIRPIVGKYRSQEIALKNMVDVIEVRIQVPGERGVVNDGDRNTVRAFRRFVRELMELIPVLDRSSTSPLALTLRRNGFRKITLATREYKQSSVLVEKRIVSPYLTAKTKPPRPPS